MTGNKLLIIPGRGHKRLAMISILQFLGGRFTPLFVSTPVFATREINHRDEIIYTLENMHETQQRLIHTTISK